MAATRVKRPFPLIQRLPVPKGTEAFEGMRQKLYDAFIEKVPEDYYIAQHYVDNPPKDITSIPRECGILTDAELAITEQHDAVGLARAIAISEFTAVEVTRAFLKRAVIADQISCCLTQWLPDLALAQAEKLDEHLKKTGKTVGPLHGVPISVKQHIPLAGTYSDTGFVSKIVFDDEDCQMISILRAAGAVFHCKTAQPQSIMHLESDGYLGRVLNPHNIDLSAGGSSGGEAALVTLRGSVLGIGTDIGGSIRGPAGKCGVYGFKPTVYTLPMTDFIRGGFPAELNILCSAGPICSTMRDMDLFQRSLIDAQPYLEDPRLSPNPWTGLKTQLPSRPLRVGIMLHDGVIQPQPPVVRALKWAQERLAGLHSVELVPYVPYKTADAMSNIRKMYWPDGGAECKAAAAKTGEPLHLLTLDIIKDAEAAGVTTYKEITENRLIRDEYRSNFAKDWNAQNVDVVLCPMFVGPAPAHDTALYWNYTALWNFVDYPGVVFPTPIKAAAKGVERYDDDGVAWNDQDAHVRKFWEDGNFENAPIALQLVGRKHHDNQLFGALELLAGPLGLT